MYSSLPLPLLIHTSHLTLCLDHLAVYTELNPSTPRPWIRALKTKFRVSSLGIRYLSARGPETKTN